MRKGQVPPYPQFYELFYTYSSGVDPEFNARVNAALKQARSEGQPLAQRLREEFLGSPDLGKQVAALSERMSQQLDAVHGAIDQAKASASAYSGSLNQVSDELAGGVDPAAVQALALQLLTETRRMQQTNIELEQQLDASRDDIATLRQDLDTARKESLIDPLTRVYNRKCFDETLDSALAACKESGEPLALALIDIDHFKVFNDSWGHQTGDQVLRLVAATIKACIRGRDTLARYGGEEFAVILPQTDLDGAVHVAETLRNAIESKQLLRRSTNERLGRITASFGVAVCTRTDTAISLVERADQGLYRAKSAGRNCVVVQNTGPQANTAA